MSYVATGQLVCKKYRINMSVVNYTAPTKPVNLTVTFSHPARLHFAWQVRKNNYKLFPEFMFKVHNATLMLHDVYAFLIYTTNWNHLHLSTHMYIST